MNVDKPVNGAVSDLPEGTVTFLFTDIEGSTKLLRQLGDEYASVLADQRRILREIFAKWHGREVDTQGDSFFISFPRATEAVAAAVEIQRALTEHSWPQDVEVRLRMGLHTGEPWLVEEGYVGMDVHRAARIGHAGHGGQVLLSETTTSLVLDELMEGVSLQDLGRHRLKDMRRPERISQLVVEGLPSSFPPLKSQEKIEPTPAAAIAAPKHELRQVGSSPYRGLAAFRETDASLFFGREVFTEQLALAVQERGLVAVIVGPSGSGKSSTVFAGLLPQLRDNSEWLIIETRPGSQPFYALAGALLPAIEDGLGETERMIETKRLAQAIQEGELSLFQVVNRALERHPDVQRILLVIDQFEELFTLRTEPEEQRLYLDELLAAVEVAAPHRRSHLVLLLTLRADFMGQALTHRPFADTLQEGSLILGPMNREELQTAIEKPAELQGAAFESGLVQRILDDVGQEPGNLPLLEFALTLLWERMDDGWMTHAAYEEIGRVDGALARYAEEVFDGLNSDDKENSRRLFVQLVQPGEGTEDTRRVASRTELRKDQWSLVQHLADRRLVVTGRDQSGVQTVEVVHEALIRGWDRLRSWMGEDRAFRTWQEGLRIALRGWEISDRDEGALLRGAPLAMAESWLVERESELSAAEQEFVQAGIDLREAKRAARDRRRRLTMVGLAAGLLVATALVIFAFNAQKVAQREADVNHSLVLSANAQNAQENGTVDLALALALEAVDMEQPPAEAIRALTAIALGAGTRLVLPGHDDFVRDVAVSPDTKSGLSGSCAELNSEGACTKGELILWDLESGSELRHFDGHTDWVNSVEFSPDGETAISGSSDGSIIEWDVKSGQAIQRYDGHSDGVNSVAFSPDGQTFLSGSDDATLILWDSDSGDVLQHFEGHTGGVTHVKFSQDGQKALSGSDDTTLILWEVPTGQEIARFEGHTSSVTGVAFHPDGQSILSSADNSIRMWDIETGEETRQQSFGSTPTWIELSPDGNTLLIGGIGTDMRIWDLTRWQDVQTLMSGRQAELVEISAAAISPDSLLALSGATDGGLRLWNLEGQAASRRFETGGTPLLAIDISPDGNRLLTGDITDQIVLWDIESGESINSFEDQAVGVCPNCISFTPDSLYGLVGSSDGFGETNARNLALWEVDTGRRIRSYEGHRSIIRSAALSPDGQLALSGSQDYGGDYGNDLLLWDVQTGQQIRRFDTDDDITSISFNADGSRALTGSVFGSNLTLWDVAAGKQIRRFEGPVDLVFDVAFGPDEKSALSVSSDGSITEWDIETGEVLRRLLGHDSWVWSLDVSPDGHYIISGDEDGTIILWDYETGEELRRFKGHSGLVAGLEFGR
ncbi:MAG: adenylate/guanylate cyclase domain-containing protein, partial [Candidatus Promineifilaceae bacterium]